MPSDMTQLPSAIEIEKLPLRAIVGYAISCARRLTSELRGIAPAGVVDRALSLAEEVVFAQRPELVNAASILLAGADVAEAASTLETAKQRLAALAVIGATNAAYHAIEGAADPRGLRYNVGFAARAAEGAGRAALILEEQAAACAVRAARKHYECLLKQCGEHEPGRMGDPIQLADAAEESSEEE